MQKNVTRTRLTTPSLDDNSARCHRSPALRGQLYPCDHLGVSLRNLAAYGDEENDIEMLLAGLGVPMGNASGRVKAIAEHKEALERRVLIV
jgi:hypothetical protein